MQRSGARTYLRTWTGSDGPWRVRLRQALRNTAVKVRTGQRCGRPGEPGC